MSSEQPEPNYEERVIEAVEDGAYIKALESELPIDPTNPGMRVISGFFSAAAVETFMRLARLAGVTSEMNTVLTKIAQYWDRHRDR